MADVVVRKVQPDEAEKFERSAHIPFLDPTTGDDEHEGEIERGAAALETDRAWVAEVSGRFVANAAIESLDVTVPAAPGTSCPVISMAGVTSVGVHPTHRRRGLLGELMAPMLDDARQRGEGLAGLIASESIIYGRYGFGLATDAVQASIDTRHTKFLVPAPEADLNLVDKHEAGKFLPELFDRQRRTRPGEPNRSAFRWEDILADRKERRGGGRGVFHAVCDDGYVSYRMGPEPDVLRARRAHVTVEELRGTTPEVEAALWRFVFDLDLTGGITARRRPVDDPLRWRLADPRQLRLEHLDDRLYVRILDMPSAFEARGYQNEGRVVLDVVAAPADGGASDPVPGKWVLDAGPDGVTCRPARKAESADLRLSVTELGALYMGGFRASLLAAAGRIEELTAGSLAVADNLLTTSPAPLTGTGF